MPDQRDQLGARYVSARHAAELTGLNERTIRRMIARGDLPAQKVAANRFAIDTRDLPTARKRSRQRELQDDLEALRRDLEALKRRVTALEAAKIPKIAPNTLQGDSDGLGHVALPPYQHIPSLPSGGYPAATLEGPQSGSVTPALITRVSDACVFLARHGVSSYTPRSWPWLRDALTIAPLTPDDLLARVIEHKRSAGYRAATIVLHECTVTDCPCHGALPASPFF